MADRFTQTVSTGATAATAAIPLLTTAATAAWAVPVVGAAAAGVLIAWAAFKKRNAQKEASTAVANDVEKFLQENLSAYQEGPRTREAQAYALAMFDDAWAYMSGPEGCGNADLGSAGRRCVSERQRGGTAPWCPTGQGCDWFTLYRDPIENDITQPSESAADVIGTLFGEDGTGERTPAALLVPIALVAAALML